MAWMTPPKIAEEIYALANLLAAEGEAAAQEAALNGETLAEPVADKTFVSADAVIAELVFARPEAPYRDPEVPGVSRFPLRTHRRPSTKPPRPSESTGVVKWYDERRGFGYITPDDGSPDIRFDRDGLAEGQTGLSRGQRVAYEVTYPVRQVEPVARPQRPGSGIRKSGTVKWFSPEKGYGFVTPDDRSGDLFVHFSGMKSFGVFEGARVDFEVVEGSPHRVVDVDKAPDS